MKRQWRKHGFTIAELMVAVAMMAAVLAGTGYIFKMAIDAQRAANATAEIMRNLRGITDQLNSDFEGLQKDAPFAIWFQQSGWRRVGDPNTRLDEIMFFAAGDFSSYRNNYGITTTTGNEVLKGNMARIWYGQGDTKDPKDNPPVTVITRPLGLRNAARVLVRNQHILNPNPVYILDAFADWPKADFSRFAAVNPTTNIYENEIFEYDTLSLAQWKMVNSTNPATTIFQDTVIPGCMGDSVTPLDGVWPNIDSGDPNTYQNLMCKGVGNFEVQWGYWYDNSTAVPAVKEWRWWPSDSDFDASIMNANAFGVFFNVLNAPAGFVAANGEKWFIPAEAKYDDGSGIKNFPAGFYPQALKFTFRLYDSKGIIKSGRTFTHIVYLK
jgi:prepilin-type N-terminal cleavage/methylation domain-containing protein